MSVITYRDHVMSADTRAYSGSHTPIGSKNKIHKLANGGLLGVVSNHPGVGEALRDWFNEGADINNPPCGMSLVFDALYVDPDGDVYFFYDSLYASGPITANYYAVGTGGEYALGAMANGADAVTAAQVACALDVMCGQPVTQIQHSIVERKLQEAGAASALDELTAKNAQLEKSLAEALAHIQEATNVPASPAPKVRVNSGARA